MRGFQRWFRLPRPVEEEIDEEIHFHLESRTAALVSEGVPAAEARRRAELEYGDITASARELAAVDRATFKRESRANWWADVGQDLRIALRSMLRAPVFTVTTLASLALGIGAATAILSVVDAVLVRPLPFAEPHQLIHLWETKRDDPAGRSEVSWQDFLDLRSGGPSLAGLEGYDPTNLPVQLDDGTVMLRGGYLTAGFFSLLGVRAAAGRGLLIDDGAPGAAPVMTVSTGLAQRRFGSIPAAVGQRLIVGGVSREIVGVLPATFRFDPLQDADLFLPLDVAAAGARARSNHWLRVVGRLAPGAVQGQAQQQLSGVMARLAVDYPESNRGRDVVVLSLRDELVGAIRPLLLTLLGAAVVVLLAACVNVANLMVARAVGRDRELAVRAALGADHGRLRRQLVVESLLLTTVGAAAGVLVGQAGSALLVSTMPEALRLAVPGLEQHGATLLPMLATVATVLAIGLIFGLGPAAVSLRSPLAFRLRAGGRSVAGGSLAMRRTLVVSQFALTVVLLAGAGLMARSIGRLLDQPIGFTPSSVLTGRISLEGPAYETDERQQLFFERLIADLQAMPGVRTAAAVSRPPLQGGGTSTFLVDGLPKPDAALHPEAVVRGVAGEYFNAMGIAVLAGRPLQSGDDARSPTVAVINATLARQLFGEGNPLGRTIRFDRLAQTGWTIVGVAADVRTGALDAPAPPTVYLQHRQAAENRMTIVIRTRGEDPAALASALVRSAAAIDRGVAVYGIASMDEVVRASPAITIRRYPLILIGVFAALAAVLSAIGIYGTCAFTVVSRRREIAVRSALGASRSTIARLVLNEAARMALLGVGIGLLAAMLATRSLRSLVYGVEAIDPFSLTLVAVGMLLVGAAASWIPARSAARIDLLPALRGDD